MDDVDDLVPSKALATVEPSLIFNEAKRQYDALVQASNDSSKNAPLTSVFDLNSYLWSDATGTLRSSWRKHLETICFAFKTKSKVVHYLQLLGNQFVWAQPLLEFVREHGRDSAFNISEQTGEFDASSELRLFIEYRQRQRGMDRRISHIDASRFTSDIHHARTIFIIPTLPFAEPTAFFSSLAAHGPPEVLSNTGKLLTYPAALLLNVDDNLQAAILKHIPPFWESDKENQGGTAYETEEKEWQALFNHLSEDAHFLAYKKDGFVKDENDEGYGYTDLSLWCAAWLGERGKTGNSEEGQKLRAARKRARYSSDSPQEDSDDDDDDDVSRRYKRSKTDEDVEIELGTQSAGSSETSREQRRGSRIMRPSNWPEE